MGEKNFNPDYLIIMQAGEIGNKMERTYNVCIERGRFTGE